MDFELFALALKNLLDNAIKYGSKQPKVIVDQEKIVIKNQGDRLPLKLEEYNKPFNKPYENSNDGLGLGLYIVNHIVQSHELKIEYNYKNAENIFTIWIDTYCLP